MNSFGVARLMRQWLRQWAAGGKTFLNKGLGFFRRKQIHFTRYSVVHVHAQPSQNIELLHIFRKYFTHPFRFVELV
jgi:hypothetical protein